MEGDLYFERNGKYLYPNLSYKINGVLFDVHNQMGGNHHEKYFQRAVAIALRDAGLSFKEQFYIPIKVNNQIVGKYFLDFLIEDRVILELKRGRYIPRNIYNQTTQYLESLNLKLAIVACFATDAVIIKRIVNEK
ncbi:MAG: GxxExxY protein [Candidatus Magasanikbacteria bacterium]|nr:GxxExxY protein [Candidatus Magasanikbacteria bacterium]